MPTPLPTQLFGAKFLADRPRALLADSPRVGKTGAAIIAADYLMAENILVVTTASGRGVWKAGFPAWSSFDRKMQILTGDTKLRSDTNIAVVGWGGIVRAPIQAQLLRREWDILIADEAHAAKTFETKRTQSLYGTIFDNGDALSTSAALAGHAAGIWALTGTPIPNCPLDIYPMMRALCPERLSDAYGVTDVTRYDDFKDRYCKMRPLKIGNGFYGRRIEVFVEGRNLAELRDRLAGFFLQRTQKDVGILEPDYETMPLIVSDAARASADGDAPKTRVLAAAEAGDTKSLEMHLGPLRRLTGEIKAHAVVEAIKEELENGLPKIVLAFWHRSVGQILLDGLSRFGVAGIDGSTQPTKRTEAERAFLRDPKCRVFLGQIQAAGEAIDLSSAADLVFVETSFSPKDMAQMALRVTNHTQKRRPLVRVATLENSIDDALQQILLRKWSAIKEVLAA